MLWSVELFFFFFFSLNQNYKRSNLLQDRFSLGKSCLLVSCVGVGGTHSLNIAIISVMVTYVTLALQMKLQPLIASDVDLYKDFY